MAHNDLGSVLYGQGKLAEAEACYRQAPCLPLGYTTAHNNLGILLYLQGRLDEAEACYRRALKFKPELALVTNGWEDCNFCPVVFKRVGRRGQWRLRAKEVPPHLARLPGWTVPPGRQDHPAACRARAGRHHPVHPLRPAGQTLGRDGDRGMSDSPLLRLLATCPGIDRLAGPGGRPARIGPSRCRCPACLDFQTSPDTIPAAVPYLFAGSRGSSRCGRGSRASGLQDRHQLARPSRSYGPLDVVTIPLPAFRRRGGDSRRAAGQPAEGGGGRGGIRPRPPDTFPSWDPGDERTRPAACSWTRRRS